MASNIKKVFPMLDYVLIQRAGRSLVSKGGIIFNDSDVEKSLEGTIIALGPGARHRQTGKYFPIPMKTGDRVLLPEYGGSRVEIENDEEEYLLFRESEILAKIEKSE